MGLNWAARLSYTVTITLNPAPNILHYFSQILHFSIPIGESPSLTLVKQIQIGGENWLGLRNVCECFHLHCRLDGFCFVDLPEGPE